MSGEGVGPSLVATGILLLLLGFVLVMAGAILSSGGNTKTEWAVVGFIGPIPIGAGSDKRLVVLALLVGLLLYLLVVLASRRVVP